MDDMKNMKKRKRPGKAKKDVPLMGPATRRCVQQFNNKVSKLIDRASSIIEQQKVLFRLLDPEQQKFLKDPRADLGRLFGDSVGSSSDMLPSSITTSPGKYLTDIS